MGMPPKGRVRSCFVTSRCLAIWLLILIVGQRVGWLSSGGYGHSVGQNIGLGYVRNEHGVDDQYLEAGKYELEVRNQIVPARLHLQALYDPDNLKLRS